MGRIRLQSLVLVFVGLSCLVWLSLTILYIPYILFLSPSKPINPDIDPQSAIYVPNDPYRSAQISAVFILFGLFVDSLLISGIYRKYTIDTDMFYPWFIYYSIFIVGLIVVSVMIGLWSENKILLVGPSLAALVYLIAFVFVFRLYLEGKKKVSYIMEEMQKITLEPLAAAVLAMDEERN